MDIAVVGVTGLVGNMIMKVLDESSLGISKIIPVASPRSYGKSISFRGYEYEICSHEKAIAQKPDIALFSAGSSVSLEWAPKYANAGITVIDNSSAWRMDAEKKLIVPEVNAEELTRNDKIIANPNCSTIQMVAALAPLHKRYGIKRLVISTYQSFTGTGVKAVQQYQEEKAGNVAKNPAYPHPIFENCIPHCDVFLANKYTKEEMKLVHETRKILGDNTLAITATAVRVPVHGGHSEAVNVEFRNQFDIIEVNELLNAAKGLVVQDDVDNNIYPLAINAKDKNDVFVGRIRRDESIDKGLNLWIVSDNLRKGAATNAVQIAEYLIDNKMI